MLREVNAYNKYLFSKNPKMQRKLQQCQQPGHRPSVLGVTSFASHRSSSMMRKLRFGEVQEHGRVWDGRTPVRPADPTACECNSFIAKVNPSTDSESLSRGAMS